MNKIILTLLFFSSCVALFFNLYFFPEFRLLVFLPFLSLAMHRLSFFNTLKLAFLSGIVLDLLSIDLPMGFHVLSYLLATSFFYSQKKFLFDDKLFSLALFMIPFSCFTTLIERVLLFFCERELPLTWKSVSSDLLLMPIFDALFAILWFTIPLRVYRYWKKRKVPLSEEA